MLLTSSFMLNHMTRAEQWTVFPWVHSTCNHLRDTDQLWPAHVPDRHPMELVPGPGLLSMCAGDFVEVGLYCCCRPPAARVDNLTLELHTVCLTSKL